MKRYSVKPPTEISIDFEDVSFYLRFDAKALQHASDLDENEIKQESPAEICALIVYMGGCDYNQGLDITMAREIVSNLDIGTITGIIEDFSDSMPKDMVNSVNNDVQKKTMQRFLDRCKK